MTDEQGLAREMLTFAQQRLEEARADLDRVIQRDWDAAGEARARDSIANAERLIASARQRLASALDPPQS